jgi:hypothetical protein
MSGTTGDPGQRADASAFAVEQHGIDHIAETERRGRPSDLFWIWFGANVIFTYVIDGAIIVGLGLSLWPALAVTVIGSAFYVLVGLCAIPGTRAGTATLAVSRSAFGVRGNAPVAFLSWLTAVGWEAVNIVIGALSLYEILQQAGSGSGAGWKAVALVVVVVLTFGVAVLGHAAITALNKVFSWVLGIGTVVLGVLVLPHTHLHAHPALAAPTPAGAWLLALLVMAAAPLSWGQRRSTGGDAPGRWLVTQWSQKSRTTSAGIGQVRLPVRRRTAVDQRKHRRVSTSRAAPVICLREFKSHRHRSAVPQRRLDAVDPARSTASVVPGVVAGVQLALRHRVLVPGSGAVDASPV